MNKIKFLIFFSLLIVLSGCQNSQSIIIDADDIVIQVGTKLQEEQVINMAIKNVTAKGSLVSGHIDKLKGLEQIDWNEANSYKLTYQVCVSDNTCNTEDFEVNVVNDINDPNSIASIRKVFLDSYNISVPLGTELTANQIINSAVFNVIDSSDNSFSASLSITGLDNVRWNQVGSYKVSIGGCDKQLNCDETDTIITIDDSIDEIIIQKQT